MIIKWVGSHFSIHDSSFNCMQDQRIAVIGNGSSGIQIVPSTLPHVAHIDHYMRSRTWISPTFARGHLDQQGIDGSNCE